MWCVDRNNNNTLRIVKGHTNDMLTNTGDLFLAPAATDQLVTGGGGVGVGNNIQIILHNPIRLMRNVIADFIRINDLLW